MTEIEKLVEALSKAAYRAGEYDGEISGYAWESRHKRDEAAAAVIAALKGAEEERDRKHAALQEIEAKTLEYTYPGREAINAIARTALSQAEGAPITDAEISTAVHSVLQPLPTRPREQEGAASPRNCTCHPDDNPPVPCEQKYALSECIAAYKARDLDNPNTFHMQPEALPAASFQAGAEAMREAAAKVIDEEARHYRALRSPEATNRAEIVEGWAAAIRELPIPASSEGR